MNNEIIEESNLLRASPSFDRAYLPTSQAPDDELCVGLLPVRIELHSPEQKPKS